LICAAFATQTACAQNRPSADPGTNGERRVVVAAEKDRPGSTSEIIRIENDPKIVSKTFPSLKAEADAMCKAYMDERFADYADHIFPYLIEIRGGREKFTSEMKTLFADLHSNGVKFEDLKIGKPVRAAELADGTILAVLPMESKMSNGEKITVEKGNFLAVSDDKGVSWKFIRATSKERFRFLFPNAVDNLNFSDSEFSR
jgi:hypothetical protein